MFDDTAEVFGTVITLLFQPKGNVKADGTGSTFDSEPVVVSIRSPKRTLPDEISEATREIENVGALSLVAGCGRHGQ